GATDADGDNGGNGGFRMHGSGTGAFTFINLFDIFADLCEHVAQPSFASGSGSTSGNSNSKPDETFMLQVTLEDLFVCAKKKLKIKKTVSCYACNGMGGTQNECTKCNGAGYQQRNEEN